MIAEFRSFPAGIRALDEPPHDAGPSTITVRIDSIHPSRASLGSPLILS
jgi:hypothetical protein